MRIVWLAAADARGHLMRAHLIRALLARRGASVEIVTTSEEGRDFLAALGTPSTVLSRCYGVAFDAWQNMDRARTEACVLRYLLTPSRGLADVHRLGDLARGADLLVNDFHPLLLALGARAPSPAPRGAPIVHVYGEHLWRAIERNFEGRGPAFVDQGFGACARALRDRAYGRVEHTLAAPPAGERCAPGRTFRLPPLVAAPRRPAAEVRAALGLGPRDRLAAVYLNPHFADPALADLLSAALARAGFAVHAVGEGLAPRAGFRRYDPAFADVAAAADLLVSAPGMGALGQAKIFHVPFLALTTDQPEQQSNLAAWGATWGAPLEAVALSGADLAPRLCAAVARLAGPRAAPDGERRRAAALAAQRAVHARWTEIFLDLARRPGARSSLPYPSLPRTHHSEVFS